MPSAAMEIDNSGRLDAARALQAKLESAKLNIVDDQIRFDTLQSTLANDPTLVSEGMAGTTDPAIVAAEVASQIVSPLLLWGIHALNLQTPIRMHYSLSCGISSSSTWSRRRRTST